MGDFLLSFDPSGLHPASLDWLHANGFKPDQARTLPDGVYIGLPEQLYFLQDRLGTTDQADLWLRKEGWWWKSKNNPHRRAEKEDTEAKTFGSAAHALILEGREAFEARFAVLPSQSAFPDLLVTRDDLISALGAVDAPGNISKAKLDDLAELAGVYLKGRHVWHTIETKFKRQAAGPPRRLVITGEEAWQLDVMLAAGLEDPDMAAVIDADGGVKLSEVSVLYEVDGIPLRFRFDSLLPAANVDLKTLGNVREVGPTALSRAVSKRIGDGALDVQAAVSFEARRAAYQFIGLGWVYGGTEEQQAWVHRFPAEAPLDLGGKPGWSWCWLFFAKAEHTGRAPTIFPVWMDFGGLAHRDGWRKAVHARALYVECVAKFGLDQPWTKVEPLHFIDPRKDQPQVVISPYVEQPFAVAGEREVLSWTS